MSSNYRIALGHDVVLGSTTLIDPQPTSDGVQVARRQFAADGTVHDSGSFVVLRWNVIDGAAEYKTLLTQFGLHNANRAAVTLNARDEIFEYQLYNAWAIRPLPSWSNYFPRGLQVVFNRLEAI